MNDAIGISRTLREMRLTAFDAVRQGVITPAERQALHDACPLGVVTNLVVCGRNIHAAVELDGNYIGNFFLGRSYIPPGSLVRVVPGTTEWIPEPGDDLRSARLFLVTLPADSAARRVTCRAGIFNRATWRESYARWQEIHRERGYPQREASVGEEL